MQLLRKGLNIYIYIYNIYYRVFLDSCKNVADKMRLTEFVLQITTKGNIEQYWAKKTQQIIKPSLLSFKNECL